MNPDGWLVKDDKGRLEVGYDLQEVLMRYEQFRFVDVYRASLEIRRMRFVRRLKWRTIGWLIGENKLEESLKLRK
jgi:hypothetical protein